MEDLSQQAFALADILATMFPQRPATPSELEFFRQRPEIAGYASDYNDVVLNPTLPAAQHQPVLLNERLRQYLRAFPNLVPQEMTIAEHQQRNIGGPYQDNPTAMRQTILSRLLSGDPSASPFTWQQQEAGRGVLSHLNKAKWGE